MGEGPRRGDMDSRWSKSFPHPKPHGFRPNGTALHGGEGLKQVQGTGHCVYGYLWK